jgi:hypothetical protein
VFSLSINLTDLAAMKEHCQKPIDKSTLVDIRDVNVNENLPEEERIIEFIKLIGNPYLYKYGDKVIRIKFSPTETTFEDRVKGYFQML